jgi:hypothetical protein
MVAASSAKKIDYPEENREHKTHNQAGHNRKVEGGVAPLVDDIARQPAQSEWKLRAKNQQRSGAKQHDADNQQRSPEFTQWVHANGNRRSFYLTRGAKSRKDALDQFRAGKKVGDFKRGSLGRVRTMGAIVLDAGAQIFSDRARRSFRRVGGTHDVAPLCDGVISLEDHSDNFSGAHKFREVLEERPLAVHGVEALGFRSCNPQRFDREDLKFRSVNAADDFTGQAASHGVRLYDCECSLDRHSILSPGVKDFYAQNSGALFSFRALRF